MTALLTVSELHAGYGPIEVLHGLDLTVDEAVVVRGVEVAHLVPARAGPLRHHVGVTAVGLQAVAQVEFDLDPVGQSIERALGVRALVGGVERVVVVGAPERLGPLPELGVVTELLGDLFAFDTRFLRTLVPLFFRPGFLSSESTSPTVSKTLSSDRG